MQQGGNLRVLSIDFDCFQRVSVDVAKTCYPDGIDRDSSESIAAWIPFYYSHKEALMSVTNDVTGINKLMVILGKQSPDIPVMVSQSHVDIFKFIVENMKGYKGVDIVNIDMHHDLFNDNESIDCGNWLGHIIRLYPEYRIRWFANPISCEVYGLDPQKAHIKTELSELNRERFDIIFLCRSDSWRPPHLDNSFDVLLHRHILTRFSNVTVDPQISAPRVRVK